MAGLFDSNTRPKRQEWMQLQLSVFTQQSLLSLRSLGSDLATHTSNRWRTSEDPYEESWCPLCARPPEGAALEEPESFHHFLFECPELTQFSAQALVAAKNRVREAGGLILAQKKDRLEWNDLPSNVRIGLLLGNWLPCLDLSFTTPQLARSWFTFFLDSTHKEMGKIWKARLKLIEDRYDKP